MKSIQRRQLRHDQASLLWASLASAAVLMIPVLHLIGLPLEYLNALTHEMCHAIATVLTGGRVDHINVFADGSGVTPVFGGMMAVVGSAGYVGASLIGVLLILYSKNPEGARTSLRILGASLAMSMLLWVRGGTDGAWIGVAAGFLWVGALFLAASYMSNRAVLFTAIFLGLQQCLHSLQALLTLMNLSFFGERHSDAAILQQATGLPASLWAIGWSVFSVCLMVVALKGAWRNST